jgi:filamentous hemagglutinin family protein
VVWAYVLVLGDGAHAAVTLDGTLGPAGSLTGPAYTIPAQRGDTRGANLFHSFGQFSLSRGESATFTGPANIQNIVGRVTGGEVSNIDGLLRSSISGANLYLINPSGVVFGPSARLDVSGSFYASTADYLSLADGGRFDARNPGASILTSAPPAAFGFLGPPTPITVSGSLGVSNGKTLGLTGGNLTISGSQASLDAPSGRIDLVAVSSVGQVPLSSSPPDTSAFSTLGEIVIAGNAVVSTAGDPGGTIYIRSGHLVVESALLDSGTLGASDHPGVGIDIGVRGEFTLGVSPDRSGSDARIDSSSLASGRAGNIRIEAGTFRLTGDPTVSASTPAGRYASVYSGAFDLGRGGDIVITGGQVEIGSNASIHTESTGSGDAGNISVNVDSLRMDSSGGFGSFISSSSNVSGVAGSLDISARDVLLQGGTNALFIETYDNSGRESGSLTLTAHSVRMLDGAQIFTNHIGAGSGGNVLVTTDDLVISGEDALGSKAGIFSNVLASGTEAAGNITVAAGNLVMSRNGMIESEVDSNSAGNIRIAARNLELSDGALLSVYALGPEFGGVSIDAVRVQLTGSARGQTGIEVGAGINNSLDVVGGGIRIDSGDLQILDGATIVSHTSPSAKVPIQIRSGRVLVSGARSSITADSFGVAPLAPQIVADDISLEAGDLVVRDFGSITLLQPYPFGQGGHLHIAADNISLSNGFLSTGIGNIDIIARGAFSMQNSAISAAGVNETGGNIAINAGSAVSLDNSSISTSVSFDLFGGGGGDIHIAANTISLSGHSSVAADGNRGNIGLVARDALYMQDSKISTQVSGFGFGGNITVAARSMIDLNNSAITASVQGGVGDGGNISIDPDFLVLNHSLIAADAIGGKGGNVIIVAGNFMATPDSSITASSVLGVQGNVVIRAPTQDLSGDLAKLPETAIDAASRFRNNCAAVGSRFSSFTVSGHSVASAGLGLMPSTYSGMGADTRSLGYGNGNPEPKYLLARATVSPGRGCRF